MKLIVLPLMAFIFFRIYSVGSFGLLEKVAIILLSSPSAQINYILASGMKGDSELASGGIIFSTVFSALSFIFWIGITAA
jgi:predicted permease